jgi:hypothetical protein
MGLALANHERSCAFIRSGNKRRDEAGWAAGFEKGTR